MDLLGTESSFVPKTYNPISSCRSKTCKRERGTCSNALNGAYYAEGGEALII